LAKVFVQGDQDLSIAMSMCEDLCVTRIARPICSGFNLMSARAKRLPGATPDAAVDQHLHGSAIRQSGLNSFVADDAPRINEAGADIVQFEPRVTLQDRLRRVTRGEHPEHVFDSESMLPDDRLAAEDGRVRCDARE